ncbi:MAG: DNA methylase [Ruminococcus sp.]|nr:DNA methylase [Ruminococcus sp.]
MSADNRIYIAIDLKSFYASVECAAKGLDPLDTNLVVADPSRTEKTICLAVSPALKSYKIPGRARLFEVIQRVKEVNSQRLRNAPQRRFTGISCSDKALKSDPSLELDYIVAPPRMAEYMRVSTEIYNIYLRYIAPEDIHVYSIDEVFIDATNYLKTYRMNAHELAIKLIREVLSETKITATAGIGTNLYLAKVAMDIVAKHMPADKDGVRIAELDEMSYRQKLWTHRPLTDFWRIGRGYSEKLEANGMYTLGDVARCSLGGKYDRFNEELLYKLFGINAELLIDHAWGWEPCTIADIKAYKPENNSISSGQVLQNPYETEAAKLVIREMADMLSLDLVDKGLVTDQIVLTVGYDIENMKNGFRQNVFHGQVTSDHYGRKVPKSAHGSVNIGRYTSSSKLILNAVSQLFDKIVVKDLLIRRMYVVANHVIPEKNIPEEEALQLDLFTDYEEEARRKEKENSSLSREKDLQKAMLSIKKRFGKNAVLKGMNLEKEATAMMRNQQVGGHKA